MGQQTMNFSQEVKQPMKHRYQIRAFETEDGHFETENFFQKKVPHRQRKAGGLPQEQDGAGWQLEPFPEPERPKKKWLKKRKAKISEKKEPKKRRSFFRRKPQEPEVSPLDSGAFAVPDILAPASADLNNRDYVVVDGVYHTYFYITGYGYPCKTSISSWIFPSCPPTSFRWGCLWLWISAGINARNPG